MLIQYTGLKNLEVGERFSLQSLSERFASKLDREVRDGILAIRIKKYSKKGSKAYYVVTSRVDAPSVIARAMGNDWDLNRALHKTFNKLLNEIKHKFKTEGKIGRKSFKRAVRIKSRVV